MNNKYELTMTTSYVEHWKQWEALREILQNAIDFGNPEVYALDKGMSIISRNVTLDPATLLLGSSTKRDDDTTIGQFGEGYKLSCLVLCRLGYNTVIFNGPVIWQPRIEYVEKYKSEMLVIHESPGDPNNKDLKFDIDLDFDFKDRYLPGLEENAIVPDAEPGTMYVSGLYICKLSNFAHAYNFSPDRVKLGRDRQMVSSLDIGFETATIWNKKGNADAVYDMMMDEKPDVEYMEHRCSNIGTAISRKYESNFGDTMPVTTQEDIDSCDGQAYQVVPNRLKRMLHRFKDYIVKAFSTPIDRLEKWKKRWEYQLPADAKRELESILEQMRR